MMNEHLPKHRKVLPWLIGVGAVILVSAVIFFMWWFGHDRGTRNNQTGHTQGTPTEAESKPGSWSGSRSGSGSNSEPNTKISWSFNGSDWQYYGSGSAPTCDSQILSESPTNISLATSILYPGQKRGGNYKPHGGFRFDNSQDNSATVKAPMDARIFRGARYLVNGEMQYTFDFIADCGIMYRVGHLLKLEPKFQAIADAFPAAQEGDSRTTNIQPQIEVKTGEILATKAGTSVGGINTFFDFGVYDLRKKNDASKSTAYTSLSWVDAELAQHAVCWFDWLPASDAARVKSLPAADPTSGKTSDYCK